jgi:PD-(D/E)XK nuclease superfamily protein
MPAAVGRRPRAAASPLRISAAQRSPRLALLRALGFLSARSQFLRLAYLLVEESVLVGVKAMDAFAPIHDRQLDTYLRLGKYRVGLLLNFGAETMKAGIRRRANRFPDR